MSYESMTQRDARCDFPECVNDFDDAEGMRSAIIHNNDIAAFCRAHSAYLIGQGVNLRRLKEVQKDWLARGGRGARINEQEARLRREREFIASLK